MKKHAPTPEPETPATPEAEPEDQAAVIAEKMRAGLSREQALEVIANQAAWDRARPPAEKMHPLSTPGNSSPARNHQQTHNH